MILTELLLTIAALAKTFANRGELSLLDAVCALASPRRSGQAPARQTNPYIRVGAACLISKYLSRFHSLMSMG
eukprot:scaffold7226_cov387-Prasinococcus_capsulatus_cf.AAC.5